MIGIPLYTEKVAGTREYHFFEMAAVPDVELNKLQFNEVLHLVTLIVADKKKIQTLLDQFKEFV